MLWVRGFGVLRARARHNVAWILNGMEDCVEEKDAVGGTAFILEKLGEQKLPRAVRESLMVIML